MRELSTNMNSIQDRSGNKELSWFAMDISISMTPFHYYAFLQPSSLSLCPNYSLQISLLLGVTMLMPLYNGEGEVGLGRWKLRKEL